MTPLLFVAVAVAGGTGAAARLLVDGLVASSTRLRYPVGTTVVNVSGSFALGLVTGLALIAVVPVAWQVVLGGGFLGGYTTFSTASLETVRLLADRRPLASLANAIGILVLSVAAAAAGTALPLLLA